MRCNILYYYIIDYFKNKFKNINATSSDTWNTVSQVLGKVRSEFPSQILIAGKLLSNPLEMATSMNKFFVKKISDLKSNDSNSNDNPLKELNEYLQNKNIPDNGFKLCEITEDETIELIKSLKGKKSCGLDWICGYSLKLVAKDLVREITILINLSIKSGTFYSKWKKTKVLPGYKNKGTRYEAKYYRPISNLSEVSKLPEKAVYKQVYTYFLENNLIHPDHHGFLAHHSTATALQQIDLDILLQKLKTYRFDKRTNTGESRSQILLAIHEKGRGRVCKTLQPMPTGQNHTNNQTSHSKNQSSGQTLLRLTS